jgi:hypothetical protein
LERWFERGAPVLGEGQCGGACENGLEILQVTRGFAGQCRAR